MEREIFNNFIMDYRKKIIEFLKDGCTKIISIDKVGKGLISLAIFAVLLWLLMFLIAFVFVSSEKLDTLGKTGDFFNVATSLFTAFTVCLVAYTIYQQRLEFTQLRSHAQKEAAINRAIKLIEEWKEIPEAKGSDGLSKDQHRFIKRLFFMKNPKFKDYIDFSLINGFLIDEGVVFELELECVGLDREIRKLNRNMESESYIAKEIESRLSMKKMHKEMEELIPDYLKSNEIDLEDTEPTDEDYDIRDYVLSDIENSIIGINSKKNEYEEIIDFIKEYR